MTRMTYQEMWPAVDFPTHADEGWKYLSLDTLLKTSFDSLAPHRPVSPGRCPNLPFGGDEVRRLIIRNGQCVAGKVAVHDDGVVACAMSEAVKHYGEHVTRCMNMTPSSELSPFEAVNRAQSEAGSFLLVPAHTQVSHPIHMVVATDSEKGECFAVDPRLVIDVEDGASVDVVVSLANVGDGLGFSNTLTMVRVGKGATLRLNWMTHLNSTGYDFATVRMVLDESSHVTVVGVTDGQAGIGRHDWRIQFNAPNADLTMKGIAMLGGDSQMYHHVVAHHMVPACKEDQLYKTILTGNARSEFNSLVHIHRDAFQSDSAQLNKNLVLSDTAKAHSRPQLKVYADDVKAAHGSTIGQLDPHELFYLKSRGINEAVARGLLTYGFVEEVVQELTVLALREKTEAVVQDRMKALGA